MIKIETKQLQEGAILAQPVITPLGQPLAPAGSAVTRQLINRMKLYRVEYAEIEGEEPAPQEEAPKPVKEAKTYAQESKTHSQKVAGSSEFRTFQIEYVQAIELMKQLYTAAIKDNKPIDSQKLLGSVADLFQSRNTIVEMFDMLYNMRTVADSVYAHSLNVALISRMIGRWLRFERHDLDILTLAGLMHDIGKLLIPSDILNKPGSLTDEEFAKIKQHPALGYEILKRQPDGSGYPTGLTEDYIDNFAMIVAIADVYDAMTAARSYRSPLCPFEVISKFEEDGFQKYHTKYILVFLKQIASTYQSNRVILSDGRGCTIVMLNQNALSRPIVQFDDKSCLDLSTASRDLYIKAVL